jgi:ABC-2 type transport system permease protein
MRRIVKVAQREYIATVRTKTFILGVLFAPIIVVAVIFFVGRVEKAGIGPRRPMEVTLVDLSGELAEELKSSFDKYNKSHPQRQLNLQLESNEVDFEKTDRQHKQNLRAGKLGIYIVTEPNVVSGSGRVRLYTCKAAASDFDMPFTVENLINGAVVNRRCALQNISPKLLSELRRRVAVDFVDIGSVGKQERIKDKQARMVEMMVPFFFMYLMFFGIFVNSQQMLTSIIEEKSSRVIEVLLSSVSPFELMAGKILGLVGIGLTVVGLWAFAAYGAALWKGLEVGITTELAIYFVVYYILGFLLLSSILAGVGSVCNTLKEAQSLMMPVTLIFIIPLISWFNLVRNPDGVFARALTYFPPLTPMVMVLRLTAGGLVLFVEIVFSVLLLIVSTVFVMWASAKVFRTGILLYGKRPGLLEVLRWLRQS